jgi:HEAT repeat protein
MSPEEERLKKWLAVLNEPDAQMSRIAAEKLGDLRNTTAIPDLIRAMQHRTAQVASAAALALGKIGDKSASPSLIKTLHDHQDVMVQTAAAEALGHLRDTQAIAHLKQTIDDYLDKYKNDRFNLTRGMSRGLFTTSIAALRNIGTVSALRIAQEAEKAG